jgi:translation elongation factor EF-1alpha
MPEDIEEGNFIGKVTHYFPHVGAAVFELTSELQVGDTIRIVGGETDFTQEVESMQIDRMPVQKAEPGDNVAVKVSQKVREGYKVYKV